MTSATGMETIAPADRMPSGLGPVCEPEIDPERCVLALSEVASCKACVDACPRDAWILTDDSLGLDTEACDGCGLCRPVCPEAAISHGGGPAFGKIEQGATAFASCELTGLAAEDGVFACVHALGLGDLIRAYLKGVRHVLLATGDCDACPRGKRHRLDAAADEFNRYLTGTGFAPLELERRAAEDWRAARDGAAALDQGPKVSRRRLFRAAFDLDAATGQSLFRAPGQLIPRRTPSDPLPHVPSIDAELCSGCDACVQLCPHRAIALEKDEGGQCYRVQAERCTACGLCVDACDQDAVAIHRWAAPGPDRIVLRSAHCRACGNPFHLPAGKPRASHLCPICERAPHHRRLYQVLE